MDCMKDLGYDPMFFLRMLFEGYSNCLCIDTGVAPSEKHTALSMDFASRLNLKHECCACNLKMLQDTIGKGEDPGAECHFDGGRAIEGEPWRTADGRVLAARHERRHAFVHFF